MKVLKFNPFAELIVFVAFVVAACSPTFAQSSVASAAAAPMNPIPAEQAGAIYIAFNDLMQGPMNFNRGVINL